MLMLGLVAVGLLTALLWTAASGRKAALRFATELNTAMRARHPAHSGSPMRMLEQSVKAAAAMINDVGHRSDRRHPVTGLETRENLLAHIERSGSGLLGVVEMYDFDALSASNVQNADAALRVFAQRAVRMTGGEHMVAQIDRARLAIWFEFRDGTDHAAEFNALCYALADRISGNGIDLLPKVRSGAVARENDAANGSALLARAIAELRDGSMPNGRKANTESAAEAGKRIALEHDLRQAVARHQFTLHYQPFVDAEYARVSGVEALIRWHHPEHGAVSPEIFVPLMEKTGLAEEIGLWALDTAIADAAFWRRNALSDVKVAVNLSAHQLARADLDTVLARMLARHHLPCELLQLELTETVAAIDSCAAADLFGRLRAQGISISIDDFGAGYSSLSYLKKLSFDKLKIDREFVTSVDSDRQSQAICQSIIALGRGLGITILAEGVERVEEYLWLRRHGCRFFQGYYFSRPLPRSEFIVFAQDVDALLPKIDFGPTGLRKKIGAAVA